ncbi:MAG TPA: class III extradiol ring-cleavage dioxygenase [Natronosporangium sp.]
MPTLFLSHGGVTLADDPVWTQELADWAARLPTPESILVVSAHWEEAPLTVGATETSPPVYDLTSLPPNFWDVAKGDGSVGYPAPGAPDLATEVVTLLGAAHHDPDRGLDHGAFMPLREMYPKADIPVLQISLPSLDPMVLLEVGRRLAPLRDQGVLIIGSGFTTHNLNWINPAGGSLIPPPAWSVEFDDWAHQTVAAGDVDALIQFERLAPAARIAHPRTEHFAPLFVALGAALDRLESSSVVEGFWYGLSKRSFQFS